MSKVVKVCKTFAGPPEEVYLLRERCRARVHHFPLRENKPRSMSFNAWYCYKYDLPGNPFYVLDKEQDF